MDDIEALATVSPAVALELIERAARRAEAMVNDEEADRQLVLEGLISVIDAVTGRVH